jgi:hypothetical protein
MEMLNQSDLEFIADTIPYFPFHGVDRFYDISGLVAHPAAFQVSPPMTALLMFFF